MPVKSALPFTLSASEVLAEPVVSRLRSTPVERDPAFKPNAVLDVAVDQFHVCAYAVLSIVFAAIAEVKPENVVPPPPETVELARTTSPLLSTVRNLLVVNNPAVDDDTPSLSPEMAPVDDAI